MAKVYFIGVDVGTGSARAALVNDHGKVLATHVKPIKTWNPVADHYEQSSNDIWSAVCECVQVSSATKAFSFFQFDCVILTLPIN